MLVLRSQLTLWGFLQRAVIVHIPTLQQVVLRSEPDKLDIVENAKAADAVAMGLTSLNGKGVRNDYDSANR